MGYGGGVWQCFRENEKALFCGAADLLFLFVSITYGTYEYEGSYSSKVL
jgi:hypothetical protein